MQTPRLLMLQSPRPRMIGSGLRTCLVATVSSLTCVNMFDNSVCVCVCRPEGGGALESPEKEKAQVEDTWPQSSASLNQGKE